jgi:hypothetical protein
VMVIAMLRCSCYGMVSCCGTKCSRIPPYNHAHACVSSRAPMLVHTVTSCHADDNGLDYNPANKVGVSNAE